MKRSCLSRTDLLELEARDLVWAINALVQKDGVRMNLRLRRISSAAYRRWKRRSKL